MSKLSQCAAESLKIFLRTGLGLPEGIIGAALTILTFGDYARWHPHIHTIVHGSLGCPWSAYYHCQIEGTILPSLVKLEHNYCAP